MVRERENWGVDLESDAIDGFESKSAAKAYAKKSVKDGDTQIATVLDPEGAPVHSFYMNRLGSLAETDAPASIAKLRKQFYPAFHRGPAPAGPSQQIKGDYKIVLASVANYDYTPPRPGGPVEIKKIKSLEHAVELMREYIKRYDLGGGNISEAYIYKGEVAAGRVSYNGRIWNLQGKEAHITLSLAGLFNNSYETHTQTIERLGQRK